MPIRLIANSAVPRTASPETSTVGEPSVSQLGGEVLYSGNWFAATRSAAGSWTHLSPFTFLPPGRFEFCCDQTIIAVPSHGIVCWILQYSEDASGTNAIRVAVSRGGLERLDSWRWWDIEPGQVDASWSDQWFDYNHAAVTDRFLHVGTNIFRGDLWRGFVDLRFPLDELAAEEGYLHFEHFFTADVFSLRCTQGGGSRMYLGAHHASDGRPQLFSIFRWDDDSPTVEEEQVEISPWRATGVYEAICPDGRNWLSRCDSRVTGAWVSGDVIGFLWTANRQAGHPFPYVRAVRINTTTWQVLDEPDLWSAQLAYAYPDAQPGPNGDVGLTVFRGGGALFPSHVVGARSAGGAGWELQGTRNGAATPNTGTWGDYLCCRIHPAGHWLASGYTLQGGGDRHNVEQRLVEFST